MSYENFDEQQDMEFDYNVGDFDHMSFGSVVEEEDDEE